MCLKIRTKGLEFYSEASGEFVVMIMSQGLSRRNGIQNAFCIIPPLAQLIPVLKKGSKAAYSRNGAEKALYGFHGRRVFDHPEGVLNSGGVDAVSDVFAIIVKGKVGLHQLPERFLIA